jgi:hypothetical protein
LAPRAARPADSGIFLAEKGCFHGSSVGRTPDSTICPILPQTANLKILAFLARSHYLAALMIFLTISALVVGIVRYRYHRILRILTYYTGGSLISDLIYVYAYAYHRKEPFTVVLTQTTDIAFMIFEFITCSLFILRYIGSPFPQSSYYNALSTSMSFF